MSAADDFYKASPIKRRRHRATKAEVKERREALLEIIMRFFLKERRPP